MPEAVLRRRLGLLSAAFGLLHLAPVAFVWLSSLGAAPVAVPAALLSRLFYAHFIALVTCGVGLQFYAASRSRLFYGGPFIDFTLGAVGFMLLESAAGAFLSGGTSWPVLLPGLCLFAFGLRLSSGRPLLNAASV
jgi:hypothetical protein